MQNFNFFLEAPTSTIQESIPRTEKELLLYDKIACSISGGSDSDTMLDFICRIGFLEKVQFYFFDTGIEMEATKKHLSFLEQKYKIKINRIKPSKGVAYTVKKYGYPFLSKQVSEYIGRLQRHGFQWEDKSLGRLLQKYPKCKVALRWWCNDWGENSKFNIDSTPYLKEFLMQNPPKFLISPICCKYSKKDPAEKFRKENNIELTLIGIRKAEGGVRSTAYKTCISDGSHGRQHFPLFWWKSHDKTVYDAKYDVVHSDAYTVYGCKRTGCAGCPFGSNFESEIEMLKEHEPKLALAIENIFGPSYEYTRQYREFKKQKEKKVEDD